MSELQIHITRKGEKHGPYPEATARQLMIEAFVGEVIERFADVPIRNHFKHLFSQWLRQAS